jgi:hypothetical protein
VTTSSDIHGDLLALDTALGERRLALRLGGWEIVVEGTDADLSRRLGLRWGGFVAPPGHHHPRLRLRLFEAEPRVGLGAWNGEEVYALEPYPDERGLMVRSHHFALAPDPAGAGVWRAGIVRTELEAIDRIVENVVRYLVGRLAVEDGGLGLHGAGVLRRGKAYVFAGPPESGKTTAASLSPDVVSLGDDFAVVLPGDAAWRAFAVPFDNREQAPADPPRGFFPLAGVWRLYHASSARVESLAPTSATASLMGCAAFPWAMPDLSDRVLENAGCFTAESFFANLHFRREPDFWPLIETVERLP